MEGPISFWGYKEQESNLILPKHDDDDDDDDDDDIRNILNGRIIAWNFKGRVKSLVPFSCIIRCSPYSPR